jgi:hypothetical protein
VVSLVWNHALIMFVAQPQRQRIPQNPFTTHSLRDLSIPLAIGYSSSSDTLDPKGRITNGETTQP